MVFDHDVTYEGEPAKGWSTRQLAEMAGTTVKTIRHYHEVGLLDEPERRGNGYKAYGPQHLADLLHILRMREIGFPVARIIEVMGSKDPSAAATHRLLDEVEASIRRLQAIREDLLSSLGSNEHWTLPRGFADVSANLSDADRVLSLMMSRHLTQEAMTAVQSINAAADPVDAEFEHLPADASEEAIADLAHRMAPRIRQAQADHPMPECVVPGGRAGEATAARAMGRALAEVYNPAQINVITQALQLDANTHPGSE